MAVSMYMGQPLSGDIPNIAIDLYDKSLRNLAPSYLTHLLNQKLMNGYTDKGVEFQISPDGSSIAAIFDDGSREVLVQENPTRWVSYGYAADGTLMEKVTTDYDELLKKIRQSVTAAGSINGIVPFQDATFEEIAVMLKRHYAGVIDLSEFWHVGDTKIIKYSGMEAINVGESHAATTQLLTIIGFNHDDMSSGGKAAVTLQFSNGLGNAGYMHRVASNVGGWRDSNRRAWCNEILYAALDPKLQALIKPVDKLTSLGNRSTSLVATSDKTFLLSESEIVGTTPNLLGIANEGEQYPFFVAADNRKKKQSDVVSGYDNWWTRSPAKANGRDYLYVESDGDIHNGDSSGEYRIVPAFCI